jgi:hypothetical protein
LKHGRSRYVKHRCRCHVCRADYKASLRKKRASKKPHHELKPMPVMRGYDTMTLGEYKREKIGEVPRSAVRRNNWKQSAI